MNAGDLTLWVSFAIFACALSFSIGFLFARFKMKYERQDAVAQSKRTSRGNINEELSILAPGFPGKFSETRHLGKPIDFLVFKGMDEGRIEEIGFVEVKTGKSELSQNERQIRDIVEEARNKGARLYWEKYNIDEERARLRN